ncbi:MAG: DNA-binding protein, partial [Candidatus Cryptobacteroides sp.]
KVRRGEIDNINEETFPIDEVTGTVGGIAISSAAGTLNTDVWCKDYVLTPLRDTPNYLVDAVILVMYYSNCGYDPEAKAKNIRRLGLLHIKTMDWKVYSASSSNYALSSIYFDCYWQKYDYDYSKLNK